MNTHTHTQTRPGLLRRLINALSGADTAAAPTSRRLHWPAWFAVIDVETTALDAERGSLVSIGAVHPLTNETFYCQCRVRAGALIEAEAMAVNMADWIEREDLPTEAEAVAKLARWLEKRGVRLIGGKNPGFDVRWLFAAWKRAGLPGRLPFSHRTLDLHSLALAWALIHRPGAVVADGFKTNDVYRLLGMPDEPHPHHALTGARMEAEAFGLLLEKGGVL
jgi:hypothetical protein